jgi:hypothetical protein
VLALLWIAFSILTLVAAVAILFTERFPRGIFDFSGSANAKSCEPEGPQDLTSPTLTRAAASVK